MCVNFGMLPVQYLVGTSVKFLLRLKLSYTEIQEKSGIRTMGNS